MAVTHKHIIFPGQHRYKTSVKYSSDPKNDENDADKLIQSAKLKQRDRHIYQVRIATKKIIQLGMFRPISATPPPEALRLAKQKSAA